MNPASTAPSVRAKAAGRSTGGSSPQSSITCSGQPWRAATDSAAGSGVARSWRPQIRVVGTAMRASSAGGIAAAPNSANSPSSASIAPGIRARPTL